MGESIAMPQWIGEEFRSMNALSIPTSNLHSPSTFQFHNPTLHQPPPHFLFQPIHPPPDLPPPFPLQPQPTVSLPYTNTSYAPFTQYTNPAYTNPPGVNFPSPMPVPNSPNILNTSIPPSQPTVMPPFTANTHTQPPYVFYQQHTNLEQQYCYESHSSSPPFHPFDNPTNYHTTTPTIPQPSGLPPFNTITTSPHPVHHYPQQSYYPDYPNGPNHAHILYQTSITIMDFEERDKMRTIVEGKLGLLFDPRDWCVNFNEVMEMLLERYPELRDDFSSPSPLLPCTTPLVFDEMPERIVETLQYETPTSNGIFQIWECPMLESSMDQFNKNAQQGDMEELQQNMADFESLASSKKEDRAEQPSQVEAVNISEEGPKLDNDKGRDYLINKMDESCKVEPETHEQTLDVQKEDKVEQPRDLEAVIVSSPELESSLDQFNKNTQQGGMEEFNPNKTNSHPPTSFKKGLEIVVRGIRIEVCNNGSEAKEMVHVDMYLLMALWCGLQFPISGSTVCFLFKHMNFKWVKRNPMVLCCYASGKSESVWNSFYCPVLGCKLHCDAGKVVIQPFFKLSNQEGSRTVREGAIIVFCIILTSVMSDVYCYCETAKTDVALEMKLAKYIDTSLRLAHCQYSKFGLFEDVQRSLNEMELLLGAIHNGTSVVMTNLTPDDKLDMGVTTFDCIHDWVMLVQSCKSQRIASRALVDNTLTMAQGTGSLKAMMKLIQLASWSWWIILKSTFFKGSQEKV